MKLTTSDVDSIIGAIEIAESESGGDYSDIKSKLLILYPQAKKVRDDREQAWENESEKQTNARKEVTRQIFDLIRKGEPVVPQIEKLFKRHYTVIRQHYSDEICLPADLFRYHLDDLVKMGLIDELEVYVDQSDDSWLRKTYSDAQDKEFWHVLVRILEK